jgi:DNA-binding response OmpR family regulator
MLVEESRIVRESLDELLQQEGFDVLQVSVFHTLQQNLARIDFSILLTEVMTIADEIDSQLSQAMTSYIAESVGDAIPA